MSDPVVPGTGLGVLHLFFRASAAVDTEAVAAAVKAAQAEEGYQVVVFATLGHKADVGFMALGPDLWRLRRLQSALQAAGLEIVTSYVSLTEVSEYAQHMTDGMKRPRLYPTLPPEGKKAICFYPMSKRRNVGQNWFALPYEERERLMHEHGTTGRSFAGRVVQLITGSAGLDDWEWSVTLFAEHPDDLKEVVYKMRYDEASAVYAEFAWFITGMVGDVDEVLDAVLR
jgi:hydrogen peroxide-dependent heme synthase